MYLCGKKVFRKKRRNQKMGEQMIGIIGGSGLYNIEGIRDVKFTFRAQFQG